MGIRCMKCKHTISGVSSLHLVSKCPKCGNTAKDMFVRVDDKDIDPVRRQKDKEWLESHKVD
jgi:predicted  nucleic acid-binding Zn-ribbon protein